ncbi:DUF6263 family protein [uncultured Eudoraea sp.]|uniref:DUF6263 family protein n=1 Tax=uncultured Eudoraea sp. TaxID=1035614 RepID=UPI00260AEB2E|nr:DUF6263 family protein [uncultured Eudoraea sp.]
MKKLSYLLIYLFINTTLFGQSTMQYNLSLGDVFTIKQDANQIITQEIDGATHEITNTLQGIMEFRVKGDNNNTYAIDVMFKDLNLKITSSIQGELIDVNAKNFQKDDAQSKIFNSLLDVPIQIILARTGDVLEVNGGDSLVSKMANASGLEDEFSINMMKKSLEKEFGSEALADSYEQLTFIYPATPIEVGDSWKNEYAGKLQAQNTWTLNEITEASANIEGKALVVMDVVEPASTMKLNGTQNSSVITDIMTGFVKKMTVHGLAEGYTTMTQTGDQEIPTSIKSTIIYELIEN